MIRSFLYVPAACISDNCVFSKSRNFRAATVSVEFNAIVDFRIMDF